MKFALSAFVFVCAGAVSASVQPRDSRIYNLEELAWPRIDALDRARTMFILPVGMLEEHGPHLPIAADTFGVAFEAKGVASRVSQALPAWTIVIMPLIPYGESGANEIGGDLVHPGTYGIRQSTLRSLVADIGAQVAQNGFTSIFVLTGHAAPTHGIAVNEACDFVSATFGVTMLHVSGLFRADPLSDIIRRAAGGNDASRAPRAPDTIDPALETVLGDVLDNERAFESKLDQWLARRRPR